MANKPLITKNEAATRAEVTLRTIDNWFHRGWLTKHKNARGQVGIDPEELDALITYVPAVSSPSR
jgi:hypothetical protein